MSGAGKTVIFVSHNMAAVQMLCHRALVLDQGKVMLAGPVQLAISQYLDRGEHVAIDLRTDRIGTGAAYCTGIQLLDEFGNPCRSFASGDALKISLKIHATRHIDPVFPGVNITNALGVRVATFYQGFLDSASVFCVGDNFVELFIPRLDLMPAEYRVDVTIGDQVEALDQVENAAELSVTAPRQWAIDRLPEPAEHGMLLTPYSWKTIVDANR